MKMLLRRKSCKCVCVLAVYTIAFIGVAWYTCDKQRRTIRSSDSDLDFASSGHMRHQYSKRTSDRQNSGFKDKDGKVVFEGEPRIKHVYQVGASNAKSQHGQTELTAEEKVNKDWADYSDNTVNRGRPREMGHRSPKLFTDASQVDSKSRQHVQSGDHGAKHKISINSLVHAATGTVNSTGGCIHKGVKPCDPKTPNADSDKHGERDHFRETPQTSYMQENGSTDADFQPVHNRTTIVVFVYSAYFNDVSKPAVVTVVAIVNRSEEERYKAGIDCRYQWAGDGWTRVTGKVDVLPDHHGTTFAPAFIHCPAPEATDNKKNPPRYVSISMDNTTDPENLMEIHYPQPRLYNFLLCFSPLHGTFNDVTMIVQNLELAQMLGADHAVVYNTSIGPGADRVLRYYADKGFLEVKGWRNPPEPVHYAGQIGAINDCLLMNRNRSDYLVFMDFDEMIVTRFHNTWSTFVEDVLGELAFSKNAVIKDVIFMSESLSQALSRSNSPSRLRRSPLESSSRSPSRLRPLPSESESAERVSLTQKLVDIGAFAFQSSVFLWDAVTNLTAEEKQFATKHHVHFLLKQRRTVQVWPNRSKNIVNPRAVEIMGIHRVARFAGQQKTLLVNESVALLQHYRWYSPNAPAVKDSSSLRFAHQLVERMKNTMSDMEAL